jgi:magnesium chelatase family protein
MCVPVPSLETAKARGRVREAIARQKARHAGLGFWENSRIPAGLVERFCGLDGECRETLKKASESLCISSRAFHSILRMARTIADLAGVERIAAEHLAEAIQHRRYGDGDFFWTRTRSL